MRFEHGEGYEQDEACAIVICPENLPQPEDIAEWELSLESDEDPSKAEEEVHPIRFLCKGLRVLLDEHIA